MNDRIRLFGIFLTPLVIGLALTSCDPAPAFSQSMPDYCSADDIQPTQDIILGTSADTNMCTAMFKIISKTGLTCNPVGYSIECSKTGHSEDNVLVNITGYSSGDYANTEVANIAYFCEALGTCEYSYSEVVVIFGQWLKNSPYAFDNDETSYHYNSTQRLVIQNLDDGPKVILERK